MLIKALPNFLRDERGLETVEYAVMTTLIVAALLVSIVALGTAVMTRIGDTTSRLNGM